MEERKVYKTTTLQEAAALLSQENFKVRFVGLEPTVDPKRMKFVLEAETSKKELDGWLGDYINENALVQPKRYDAKLNILRDNLNRQRG